MKVYKIPENLKTIIFDIDSTLYTSAAYAFEQVDCQVREFARIRGIEANEARKMVADYRKEFADKNNGKKISLGNTLVAFGIPIETSVKWREQLLEPKEFLGRDERLIEELKILKQHFNLICVTNNPVLPARKTLEAIGVETLIPEIVGLDTCFKSKPAVEPFMTAVERIGCKVEECLAIGDRYDMDIGLPLEMGMGGILVTGVEELYDLHKLLLDE
ncbi:MAG: HAD family hydrolase [Treponema sp.]|nr:HAD family hydrolase [Treponema sp.]